MSLKRLKQAPLSAQILLALLLGLALGTVAGPALPSLGWIGKSIIQLIKVGAGPLVFMLVLDGALGAEFGKRDFGRLASISITNALAALVIGLSLAHFLHWGEASSLKHFLESGAASIPVTPPTSLSTSLASWAPTHALEPFLQNSIIGLVILALLLAAAARSALSESDQARLKHFSSAGVRVFERIIFWIVRAVPVAVFSVVADTVSKKGWSSLQGLIPYATLILLGLSIQLLVIYPLWIVTVSKFSLIRFLKEGREALLYALGASSSLATLPVTLGSLRRMGISEKSSRMAAVVGTNFNNDGILLYEVAAALFVAQVAGIDLDASQVFTIVGASIVATLGIAGIPDAGLISLALVLEAAGLPTEILPILLTVDWILSRARAATNVAADMTVAIALDHWGQKTKSRIKR